MRLTKARAATLLLLFALIAPACAHDGRVDVTLSHAGADVAGKRLALLLRNELALSKLMSPVKTSEDRIGIYLVTMALEGINTGTVYSVTWTLGGMADDGYLASQVGICEIDSLKACAKRLVLDTGKHATVLYTTRHKHPPPK